MLNYKSHIEDKDVTFGYLKGHKKQPPVPAVIIDGDCYKWNDEDEIWEKVLHTIANQTFFAVDDVL